MIYSRLGLITDKILEEGQCASRPSSDLSDVFLNLKMTVDSYVKTSNLFAEHNILKFHDLVKHNELIYAQVCK